MRSAGRRSACGVLELCAFARPHGRENECVTGAAETLVGNYKSGVQAAALCRAAPAPLAHRASSAPGRWSCASCARGPARRMRAIADSHADASACVRGGRHYLGVVAADAERIRVTPDRIPLGWSSATGRLEAGARIRPGDALAQPPRAGAQSHTASREPAQPGEALRAGLARAAEQSARAGSTPGAPEAFAIVLAAPEGDRPHPSLSAGRGGASSQLVARNLRGLASSP